MDHLSTGPGCVPVPAVHPGLLEHLQEPVWRLAKTLLADPDFDKAMLAYCRSMVEPNGFRWPANKLFAQRMRYIACYMLIGLSQRFEEKQGPAPTMTLLQTVVPGSARQVSDLVGGLRAGGYVIAEQNPLDRREIHLRPSPALVLEIARSPLCFLSASSILLKHDMSELLSRDVSLISALLSRSMQAFQTKDVLFQPFETIVDFSGRDSGYLMLCAVMGAHFSRSQGECFELPLSYDALAQRFQVSRQHVGNVLAAAGKRDLFWIQAGRIEKVAPSLIAEFSWWSAGQMAHFMMLASAVCAATSGGARIPCDLEIR